MAAPTSTSTIITINEDTPRILLTTDFPFSDTDPGDVLTSVKITTLPLLGTLKLNGVDVTLNQVIAVADITANLLVYTPALNGNGAAYATIGYQVSDGVEFSIDYVLTVNVTAVQDAPTSSDTEITINEDTATVLTLSNFPFTDPDIGDALVFVKITTLPTAGTLKLAGADVLLNQEITSASISGGSLVYTPALNASGSPYTTIGYMVTDGTTYSSAYTLTVNVTAVNDAPTGTILAISVTQNVVYSGSLPVATDVEGNIPVVYALGNTIPVYGTAVVNANGSFTYTPSNNYIGNDVFTYRVTDSLGASAEYNVNVVVVSSKTLIPFTEVTTIDTVGTDLTTSIAAIQEGTGVFDKLMVAINAHLAYQFFEDRIKGTDYANVYLGAMQVAITQAVTFVLQKPLSEKQTDSETAKKALIERQTKGFDDDAKQKLMKQMLDSWSVAYSVAKDANAIPDSIKVNPIDSVTKSAMDALGITNSNNPIGEA